MPTSQSNEPRDKKQLYNRLHHLNQTPNSPVYSENNNVANDRRAKKNEMIESIVVNNKADFFFMCSSNQIQDITKLCRPESDASVLGVNTTFNFCDLWVPDSCYKNTRIGNRATGNHPVFLGPLMFDFTKDKSTFPRFPLEIMAVDSNISHLKKVGTGMVESIYNGVKAMIPELKQLCSSLAST